MFVCVGWSWGLAGDVIKFTLKPRGGAAVRLVPVTEKEAKTYKKYNGESF